MDGLSRLDELANHIEGIRVVSFVQLLLLLLESGVLVKRIVVTETLVSGVVVVLLLVLMLLLLMRMTVMADQVGVRRVDRIGLMVMAVACGTVAHVVFRLLDHGVVVVVDRRRMKVVVVLLDRRRAD